MSDYDDYANNLFFPPVGDMSKLNDCNEGKRGSDVLLSAVDKCKELEEKLTEIKKLCEHAINVNSDAYFKYIIQNILGKIKER